MMLAIRASIFLVAASAVGCGDILSTHSCTLELVSAINVQVRDSVSGSMIASGAQLFVRDGTYADSASHPANRPELDSFSLKVAGERAGTYTVTVRKLSYRDWTRSNVQVTRDACHVIPANLTALLQRA